MCLKFTRLVAVGTAPLKLEKFKLKGLSTSGLGRFGFVGWFAFGRFNGRAALIARTIDREALC